MSKAAYKKYENNNQIVFFKYSVVKYEKLFYSIGTINQEIVNQFTDISKLVYHLSQNDDMSEESLCQDYCLVSEWMEINQEVPHVKLLYTFVSNISYL